VLRGGNGLGGFGGWRLRAEFVVGRGRFLVGTRYVWVGGRARVFLGLPSKWCTVFVLDAEHHLAVDGMA
jgi:hypothetical protein